MTLENLLDEPGKLHKLLRDATRKRQEVKRTPLNFPRTEGLLAHRSVFLIGNSPSLLKIPDVWERLSRPGLITLAVNRAIDRMDPTFWFCGDEEFTTQYGNILPRGGPDLSKTVQILHSGAGAALKMGTPWVPFQVTLHERGWGRHLQRIYHWPTSDLQALQVLHAVFVAATVYLVGVDHAMVDGLTHAFKIEGMDLEKQTYLHDEKYGPEETIHQVMIEQGYKKAQSEERRTQRPIYTCSPVEGTVVKKYIKPMSFDKAIEYATRSAEATSPLDLSELLEWKAFPGKYRVTYKP